MYNADKQRYENMTYRRSGRTGLKLPTISLGLWHNFGADRPYENSRQLLRTAFDLGITHFDLANNYGPPAGGAETTFGRALREDFRAYRNELVISTKAGYYMWPGPYGEWGSRKYLLSSLDDSLRRMKLDYVDIFYSHRFDPATPLEETMGALSSAVRQGKALYVGISSYDSSQTRKAAAMLRDLGTPCLIHQPSYSMFNRNVEEIGLLDATDETGMGVIAFCPLAQGLLTSRYLTDIPADSRAGRGNPFLPQDRVTPELRVKLGKLNTIAEARGQTLAQLALTWVLRDERVTSALIGASRSAQIVENAAAANAAPLTGDEIAAIDAALAD